MLFPYLQPLGAFDVEIIMSIHMEASLTVSQLRHWQQDVGFEGTLDLSGCWVTDDLMHEYEALE